MHDFCVRMQILPETETIAIGGIGDAFERMERGDVRYRFGIDSPEPAGRDAALCAK